MQVFECVQRFVYEYHKEFFVQDIECSTLKSTESQPEVKVSRKEEQLLTSTHHNLSEQCNHQLPPLLDRGGVVQAQLQECLEQLQIQHTFYMA